jgi:hypothetical protein
MNNKNYAEKHQWMEGEVVLRSKSRGKIEFKIVHNLPEIPGMSFEDAVNNWAHRTSDLTAESLCTYINEKDTDHAAMTREQYDNLNESE